MVQQKVREPETFLYVFELSLHKSAKYKQYCIDVVSWYCSIHDEYIFWRQTVALKKHDHIWMSVEKLTMITNYCVASIVDERDTLSRWSTVIK